MANKQNTFRTPTKEEMKQHQENHPKLVQAIRKSHGETVRKVRRRYGQNAEIMYNDRGG